MFRSLPPGDAIKTYRYLRVGMVLAVGLLATAVVIEHSNVPNGCWQTSISAYYYTPVRALFVGSLIAIGFGLVVIKGTGPFEDSFLNFAGMLAPVVALVPTTNVGTCWSLQPGPSPIKEDGSLAPWVLANIDNNIQALFITGALGLASAIIIALAVNKGFWKTYNVVDRGTRVSLTITAVLLAAAWALAAEWRDFPTKAHGYAAVLMFAFLAAAVISKAIEHWKKTKYARIYATLAAVMLVGAAVIWILRLGDDNVIAVLEGFEILAFAVFWSVQTADNWEERVPLHDGSA
ncbi:MAG TPA: hypothetical protein VEU28_06600 [Actinomycetota bacterium]|nr:hypothetical protein [Actinomycetota bacterium]